MRVAEEPRAPYGVTHWMTEDGISVARVHYTADPGKDAAWEKKQLEGYPGGKTGISWRKEMEIDFSVFGGKAVYPTFTRKRHVSDVPLLPYVLAGIEAGKNRQIINGWDNTGLSPACVSTYINSIGQWMIFQEFCGEDIGIEDFGDAVKMWWGQNLSPNTKFLDIGDPAGKTRDSRKKSPAMYLAEHCGIHIYDGIQTFKIRRECVEQRLNKTVSGGEPAILIDPSCTTLIMGFEGGYSYPEIGSTGMYHTEPQKNQYSHPHDALQYPATILWGPKDESFDEDEDDESQRRQGRSEIGGY